MNSVFGNINSASSYDPEIQQLWKSRYVIGL